MDPIRVGIIGASPGAGWAARAHIPALRALADFRITAVGTSRPESAREAARLFDVPHAFTDPGRLAGHPEVDLVVITVRVPAHADLVRTALTAGKHVYCEWPLALTTAEARELSGLAAAAGVRHAIGLQARYAPALGRTRRLLREGYVGRVLSATVYAAKGKISGDRVPQWAAYTLDGGNAAGLVEVAGGHTLDAVRYLLGDFADVSARLAIRTPHLTVTETGAPVTATAPDQLLLDAVTAEGVVVSAHIHDGKRTDAWTRIEISGTEGDLAIVSGAGGPGGIQMSELRLLGSRGTGDREDLDVEDPSAATGLGSDAANVARLYTALADDIRTGARTVPNFDTAVQVHHLLDAVRRSAAEGARVPVSR
ncbi:Gfo/Idh/MocA family protein [Nocardia terpenica]|uniref:Gfo/Idh/MocA family oxidoreductase n=1 Tax=Nocardia terpenica TaxID=455432 RepID=A0A6G9YWM0_9NOCA|nr:Gfo/Idh/MocA family oxidoreductase [Nocardia terpenica]QIS17725.1 gfo/Idh/MocA family oxidoreductase [Nocardia terpenica]